MLGAAAWLGGCASLSDEPPRVQLVSLKSLPGQGLEWRMLAVLRVQNPSASALRYEGVSLELALRGQSFASGVAPAAGELAPYTDAVIEVPITASGFGILRQVLDWVRELSQDKPGTPKLPYALRGRLGGVFGGHRFESSGVVELPDFAAPASQPKPASVEPRGRYSAPTQPL